MVELRQHNNLPLFVDLDGSLIATDSLWESLIRLITSNPLLIFCVPFWVIKGKAFFKSEVAKRVIPSANLLPYQEKVIELIRQRQNQGVPVCLATAADQQIATAVAHHLGFFNNILASDGKTNLSGKSKLAAIRELSGGDRFEYIGDTWVDVPIWRAANRAIVVDGSPRLVSELKKQMPVEELRSERRTGGIPANVRAMRCHQWIKNVLLFVPMFLAHEIRSLESWSTSLVAFFSFSLIASTVYILNDILDIESDRSHPQKKRRPFAAGELQIKDGLILASILALTGFSLGYFAVSPLFAALELVYALSSLAYSVFFKRQPIVDLILLASFYAYRVILGGVAINVEISMWLHGFSLFFFMSLAMVKRFADLIELEKFGQSSAKGRFYTSKDLPLFRSMGPATSCTSIFVLAMYISSPDSRVSELYARPDLLWLVCPILFYWIMRIWFLANRGQLDHDPIVFALRDKISYLVAVVVAAILIFATLK